MSTQTNAQAPVNVLDVLSLHTDECYRELHRLEQQIESEHVSNYGKEYADLKVRYGNANNACIAVAELIEASARFHLAFNDREAGGYSRKDEDRIARELNEANIALGDILAHIGSA